MEHKTTLKVRFSETDLLGHVNNSSYFVYLEQGRVEFFEALDSKPEGSGWQFILASVKCDFIKQAFFNQELTVVSRVSKIGNKSFHMEQMIYDAQSNEKIAASESVIIYFNFEKQQSEPVPPFLREKLELYLIRDNKEA